MTTVSEKFTYGTINTPLLSRAAQALVKHHNDQSSKEKTDLLGNDSNINVEIGLLRVPTNPSPKPIRLMIPHPLHQVNREDQDHDEEDYLEKIDICLIVKDESKSWVQALIEKFPDHLGCVKKVLGLDSLRKKFGRYEQKRELLAKYDMFLADDRILPMLGKTLGKKFFDRKQHPIPIKLTRKEALPFAVQNCLKATFMYIPSGRCISIRAGSTAMPLDKIVENCKTIVQEAAAKIPNKWKNILKVSIKTSGSISLPFYNIDPEELMEASKMVEEEDEGKSEVKANKNENNKRTRTKVDTSSSTNTDKKIKLDQKKRANANAMKSPLLKALKKQKMAEAEAEAKAESKTSDTSTSTSGKTQTEEKSGATPKSPRSSSKKEKEKDATEPKAMDDDDDDDKVKTPSASKKSPRSSSKKAKKSATTQKANDDEKVEIASKTSKKEEEKKTKKETKKDKVKKTETDDKDTKKQSSMEDDSKKGFISSKKFKGGKKGYVFKMGEKGIGYYVDVIPVVDKIKMKQYMGGKRSRSKSGGKKGGRRGR